MLTLHAYQKIEDSWDEKIKDCCNKENPDDPKGCDCCYDTWQDELKDVKTKYSASEEKAKQLKDQLSIVIDRRDRLKNWYDELTKANDLARKICDQLELLLTQAEKVGINTNLTVKAIKTLYCMIRDFYMQVDLIKAKYDRLMNCIRCLNNPAFAPGVGIMKGLEEYGKKLDALIATRDELIKMVMTAIKMAARINKNIVPAYGLTTVIGEWTDALHCDIECNGTTEGSSTTATVQKTSTKGTPPALPPHETETSCLGPCDFVPMFQFPICKDPYYACVDEQYKADKATAENLAKQLLEETKKKEALLACKQSLESAIKEVDPKARCK
jgi:hypothetical protein